MDGEGGERGGDVGGDLGVALARVSAFCVIWRYLR